MSMFKHFKRLPIWRVEENPDGGYALFSSANWIFVETDDTDLYASRETIVEGIRMTQCFCGSCTNRAMGK